MPDIPWILDFCAGCGSLLVEAFGLEDAPTCPNCESDIERRGSRIQGTFAAAEAKDLIKLFGG